MITQEEALHLFDYRDGALYWKTPTASQIKIGQRVGSINSRGYLCFKTGGKSYRNHRVIYLMHTGEMPEEVDHIDGDPLNNHIENLRAATRSENGRNRKMLAANKSGVKGVSWASREQRWRATIKVDTKIIHIGYYNSPQEAAEVLKLMRDKYHGEFANHD